MALLYFGTLVGAFVAEFVQTTTLQMLGQQIMYDMRRQVYDHLQRLDLAYYDRNPVGRLMTRVTSDVDAINDLFTSGVVSVFGDVLSLLGIILHQSGPHPHPGSVRRCGGVVLSFHRLRYAQTCAASSIGRAAGS